MIKTKRALEQFLIDHADEIRAFDVARIGVFGSFARGDITAKSDIDFMVVFRPDDETFRNFMDLADFLEEHTGRTVEILTPDSLNHRIRDKVLAQVEYVLPRAA